MEPEIRIPPVERTVSEADVLAIRKALLAQVGAVVAAAHTMATGTLVVQLHQDMTFAGAAVVPDGMLPTAAAGAAATDYRVHLCRVRAWRPWEQREIEAAISTVEHSAISW